jgi:hypothetical protein
MEPKKYDALKLLDPMMVQNIVSRASSGIQVDISDEVEEALDQVLEELDLEGIIKQITQYAEYIQASASDGRVSGDSKDFGLLFDKIYDYANEILEITKEKTGSAL